MILTTKILTELQEYIQENYEPSPMFCSYSKRRMELPVGLHFEELIREDAIREEAICEEAICEEPTFSASNESRRLEDVIEELEESFHDQLFRYIDMSGMTDVEVYKRANIDRKLFSKIRSNPEYHPRKNTILSLAVALRLNLDEVVDLLCRAEYALSPSNKADVIVKFFVEKGIYDIFVINDALDKYGEQTLS